MKALTTSPLFVNRSSSFLTSSPKCTAETKIPSEKEIQLSDLMLSISALRLDGTVSPHVHLPDAPNELSSPSSTSTYRSASSFGLALINEGVHTDNIHVSDPIQLGYNSSHETFQKQCRTGGISADRSVRAVWSSPGSSGTSETAGSSWSQLIAESQSSATSDNLETSLIETKPTRSVHSTVVSTSALNNGRDLEKELRITIHNSDGGSTETDGSHHVPLTWGTASLKLSREDLSAMTSSITRHRHAAGDTREEGCSRSQGGLFPDSTVNACREYDLPVTILPRWKAKHGPIPFCSFRTSNTFDSGSSGSGNGSGSSVTALIGNTRARLFSKVKKRDNVSTKNKLSLRVRVDIFPLNENEDESPVSQDEKTFVGSYMVGDQTETEHIGLKNDDGDSSCALRGIDKIKTSHTQHQRQKQADVLVDGGVEDVAVGGPLCRSPAAWDALQFFLDHAINNCSEDLPLPQVGEYDEDAWSFDSSIDTMDGLWMEEEWADLGDRSHYVLDQKYGEHFEGGGCL